MVLQDYAAAVTRPTTFDLVADNDTAVDADIGQVTARTAGKRSVGTRDIAGDRAAGDREVGCRAARIGAHSVRATTARTGAAFGDVARNRGLRNGQVGLICANTAADGGVAMRRVGADRAARDAGTAVQDGDATAEAGITRCR